MVPVPVAEKFSLHSTVMVLSVSTLPSVLGV